MAGTSVTYCYECKVIHDVVPPSTSSLRFLNLSGGYAAWRGRKGALGVHSQPRTLGGVKTTTTTKYRPHPHTPYTLSTHTRQTNIYLCVQTDHALLAKPLPWAKEDMGPWWYSQQRDGQEHDDDDDDDGDESGQGISPAAVRSWWPVHTAQNNNYHRQEP